MGKPDDVNEKRVRSFFKTPAWEDSRMEEEAMISETKTLVDDVRPIPKAERKGGRFTCCVPHCFNNSKRYTNLPSIKNWRPRQGKARIEGKMATYDFKKKFHKSGNRTYVHQQCSNDSSKEHRQEGATRNANYKSIAQKYRASGCNA